MLTKFIPAALLVLAALVTTARGPWSPSVTATGTSQRQPTTAMPGTPVTPPAGIHAASLVAADDYRMNLQAGVTADAYGLPPMAEHDAARTQSMIDGFSGRRMAHGGPATPPTDRNGLATSLVPRAPAAAWWLAGLMAGLIAVLWMALRRRG